MNTGRTMVQQVLHRAPWVAALLVVSMILWPALPAAAEGSRTLYPEGQPNTASRANLEWNSEVNRYGPDEFNLIRRTLLKVYARAGEYILLGSSAVDVPDRTGVEDKGDILIYDRLVNDKVGAEVLPDTPVFSCKAQRSQTGSTAQGRINSRTQELAGPDTIANTANATPGNAVANGYVPCFYQAPTTGIYNIVFYGPDGPASTTAALPTGKISATPQNFTSAQSTTIAVWDVTVRSSLTSTQDIPGRLFTYYLTMFTGTNGRPIYSTIYIATTDGFLYEVDLNAMDPNGFIIYGNQQGFLNTDGSPLYHDVLAKTNRADGTQLTFEEQNQLRELQGDVSLAPPQYPIFFNKPDPEALQFIGIPLTPLVPEVRDLKFIGKGGGAGTTKPGEGGTFSFSSNVAGIFDIVLSRDGVTFNPTAPQNRVLRGAVDATTGQASVPWDGLDNSGQPFPQNSGNPYIARTTVHGGELHFPFLDVENSIRGSPMLRMLNPPSLASGVPNTNCAPVASGCTGAFYDDRGYVTSNGALVGTSVNQPLCPGNVGNPPNPLFSDPTMGYDTTAVPNQRAFGFPTGGNPPNNCTPDGGFGDKKGLDLWTYFPGVPAETPLRIAAGSTAIDLVSFAATAQSSAVTVRWQTSAEINTFGFRLYRSTDGTRANAVLVTPELIPAQGRGQGGATYTWTDSTAQAGQRYSYWLQEVETSGATNEYGPATAITASPTRGSFLYLPLLN